MSSSAGSRASRKSNTTAVRSVGQTTASAERTSPDSGGTGSGSGTGSPGSFLFDSRTSPSLHHSNRLEEKQQLSKLNDRLAQYIERVRTLENENNRLEIRLRDVEVIERREKDNLRSAYEKELRDARRMIDDVSVQRAKVQVECDAARGQFDELRAKIGKLEQDLRNSESGRLGAQSLVQDLRARLNTADNNRRYYEDDAKTLRGEHDELKKQLETAKLQLEEETVLRVDIENRLQSCREELSFNKQLYDKELQEVRRKRQTELTVKGKELETEYKEKYQEALKAMRDDFDARLRSNREAVEAKYNDKIKDAEEQANAQYRTASECREELVTLRLKFDGSEKEKAELQERIDSLERKVRQLEEQLRRQTDEHYGRLNSKEEEIAKLRDDINRMLVEYQDLMDVKVQLDVEIEAYRKLLEGEEARLHMNPPEQEVRPHEDAGVAGRAQKRGMKRRRMVQESDEHFQLPHAHGIHFRETAGAEGDVEIVAHDVNGKFVTLHNKGDEEVAVGSWQLKQVAKDVEVAYKFHQRQTIKPGKTCTVWGSDSDVAHNPPLDMKMHKNSSWPIGDSFRATLYNSSGSVVAWRQSKRQYGSGYVSGLEDGDHDQNCCVM